MIGEANGIETERIHAGKGNDDDELPPEAVKFTWGFTEKNDVTTAVHYASDWVVTFPTRNPSSIYTAVLPGAKDAVEVFDTLHEAVSHVQKLVGEGITNDFYWRRVRGSNDG